MASKFFIAVYTNEVKDYCDEVFFDNLFLVSRGGPVCIVDNTIHGEYHIRLQKHFLEKQYDNFRIEHLEIPEQPKESQFQRNVCHSVNYLRDIFLNHFSIPWFLIIESDVIPPHGLLDKFEQAIAELDTKAPDWGIVGAIYYPGFHNYEFQTDVTFLENTHHCLSGCTVYKRDLIKKYPFRHDPQNLGPFPDAFISYDAGQEYTLWNDHRIRCDHLHVNGIRISKAL